MDEADSLSAHPQRGRLRPLVQRVDGTAAVLRRGRCPARWPGPRQLSAKCWEYEAMMLRDQHVAIPLMANDEMIAVLVLDALQQRRLQRGARAAQPAGTPRRPAPGRAALRPCAGRRDEPGAPADRPRGARRRGPGRRLARLPRRQPRRAPATDPEQLEQIGLLRQEVTRVVTELRHSIFDLRHEIAAGVRARVRACRPTPTRSAPPRPWPCTSPWTRRGPGCRRTSSTSCSDRPGGHGQRAQALRRREPVAALHGALAVRRDRGRATTASTATPLAATPRGCRSCGSARAASAPSWWSSSPVPAVRAPGSSCASAPPTHEVTG